MNKVKIMIGKKGGCNEIFTAFCQLEYLVNQIIKQNEYNQKQQI